VYLELKSKIIVAKKPHQCEWCGETIHPGVMAQYRAYVYDGEFNHGWMHMDCHDAIGSIDWEDGDTWSPGDFKRGSTSHV